jgi:formylglycine-generating enzyme required for sulfatase activity
VNGPAAEQTEPPNFAGTVLGSETPQHRVILTQPFYLGVYEVTQQEYELVTGENPSVYTQQGRAARAVAGLDTTRFPVDSVSWLDAVQFCNRLSELYEFAPAYERDERGVRRLAGTGYRLPTEAQWEFACRAGTTTKYSSGDTEEGLGEAAWMRSNSGPPPFRPRPVGQRKPNPFGLCDMHGNLAEWVQDYFDAQYYHQFGLEPAIDPLGPPRGTAGVGVFGPGGGKISPLGVHRGGAVGSDPSHCRSAARRGEIVDRKVGTLRLVLPVDAVRAAIQASPDMK